MTRRLVPRLAMALVLSALALAACRHSPRPDEISGEPTSGDPGSGEREADALPAPRVPYRGTRRTRQDIADLLARVPSAGPPERQKIQARLVAHGEPAVVPLTQALRDPSADVRMTAAYALGMIQDPRALDALAAHRQDPNEAVRFEVATAMWRMSDLRGLDPLLYGLEHADPRIRARSIAVLRERTGDTLGYRADDTPVDRSAAVARWRAWARQRRADW